MAPDRDASVRLAFERPAIIDWSASATELVRALEAGGQCAGPVRRFAVEPPFLPGLAIGQEQVECDGFDFLGRPRSVEFVVGDDRLQMVWILTTTEEGPGILGAMTAVLGPPTHRNSVYAAWPRLGTALRSNPPEVLFYAPALEADMIEDFASPPAPKAGA